MPRKSLAELDEPRRDAVYASIGSNLSTALALFISSFTITFMLTDDLTPSAARMCVLALALFLVALSCAITGGALISFDTDDARGNPSRDRMGSRTGGCSEVLLVCSGGLMFAGLCIIFTSVVCQELSAQQQQQSSEGSASVDQWPAEASCQHTMTAGVVVSVAIPAVVWVVTAARVGYGWWADSRPASTAAPHTP